MNLELKNSEKTFKNKSMNLGAGEVFTLSKGAVMDKGLGCCYAFELGLSQATRTTEAALSAVTGLGVSFYF
jgi:hypothetical protein